MNTVITGMLLLHDIIAELEILQGFMARYGFESNPVRIGVSDGRFCLLSGDDAVNVPSEEGYWSEVSTLTTEDSLLKIRNLARKLESEVSDSFALQTSFWGDGSGVIAIQRDEVNQFRMAN